MKGSVIALGLLMTSILTSGCRISGNSSASESQNEVQPGQMHCSFFPPDGTGNVYEFWATPNANQLVNVKSRFRHARDGSEQMTSISSAPVVDTQAFGKGGQLSIRAFEKHLVNIDFQKFQCYGLEVQDQAKLSYLCLDRYGTGGANREAVWATNASYHQYAEELTLYDGRCKSPL